jgi:hypothetical protein
MSPVLSVFENGVVSYSFNLSENQREYIMSFVDYTVEQYNAISEITGLDTDYLSKGNVDYWIEY